MDKAATSGSNAFPGGEVTRAAGGTILARRKLKLGRVIKPVKDLPEVV
tara:strand:+ start:653 stop:796 length:144 start_codon:yes stop_codon:yes gene_type:complete